MLALLAGAAISLASPVAPAAAAEPQIELLLPVPDDTVSGALTVRARVTGAVPAQVWMYVGYTPPKAATQLGAEVAPGIWEATFDVSEFSQYGQQRFSINVNAHLSAEPFGTVLTATRQVRILREYTHHWTGEPPAADDTFSPDGDGADDDFWVGVFATAANIDFVEFQISGLEGPALEPAVFLRRAPTSFYSGDSGLGGGYGGFTWDGRDDGGEVVPDGLYCIGARGIGTNGRHAWIQRIVRVDAAPAGPEPAAPPEGWCPPVAETDDPPLPAQIVPPLPAPTTPDPAPTNPDEPPTTPDEPPTTPAEAPTTPAEPPASPTTPAEVLAAPPEPKPASTGEIAPALALAAAGVLRSAAAPPRLVVKSATQRRQRLKLRVACAAGCPPRSWQSVELWSRGAQPKLQLSTRVQLSGAGTFVVDRALKRRLPPSLELRAPSLGASVKLQLG